MAKVNSDGDYNNSIGESSEPSRKEAIYRYKAGIESCSYEIALLQDPNYKLSDSENEESGSEGEAPMYQNETVIFFKTPRGGGSVRRLFLFIFSLKG